MSARGKGDDQYGPNLLHTNIILAISRNSDMLFENLKFDLNLVQNLSDLEIARISWATDFCNWPYMHFPPISSRNNITRKMNGLNFVYLLSLCFHTFSIIAAELFRCPMLIVFDRYVCCMCISTRNIRPVQGNHTCNTQRHAETAKTCTQQITLSTLADNAIDKGM